LAPVLWQVEYFPTLDSVVRFWQNEYVQMHTFLHGLTEVDLDRDIDYGTIQGSEPKSAKIDAASHEPSLLQPQPPR
jgi:hypothetical protein